ncbi:MAG: anaerobic ribonucleoside-triphosphate reductase activating protein, partial [Desulfobacteraceae bacterium]|nr:anaerobic ribonucleoside-triphosphate reductase activating protein [Desulfobacteraceae bacterium]
CPYCHNPELVAGPRKGAGNPLIEEHRIFSFLKKRKNLLEGVVITGGEPTLQKDLAQFCEKIKTLGYKIKLDSNGTNPGLVSFLFDNHLVDFISMDIKTNPAQYHLVTGKKDDHSFLKKSIDLIMSKAPAYEFRTTCIRPFITPAVIKEIGLIVQGASQYVLQQCSRDVDVLDSTIMADKSRFFSDQELQDLKSILLPYVPNIIV